MRSHNLFPNAESRTEYGWIVLISWWESGSSEVLEIHSPRCSEGHTAQFHSAYPIASARFEWSCRSSEREQAQEGSRRVWNVHHGLDTSGVITIIGPISKMYRIPTNYWALYYIQTFPALSHLSFPTTSWGTPNHSGIQKTESQKDSHLSNISQWVRLWTITSYCFSYSVNLHFLFILSQGFSNFSVHPYHLEGLSRQTPGPTPEILNPRARSRAHDFAFKFSDKADTSGLAITLWEAKSRANLLLPELNHNSPGGRISNQGG